MQIADLGRLFGQINPHKNDNESVVKESKKTQVNPDADLADSPRIKDQASLEYLASKYSVNTMSLHQWKNFQIEVTQLGLMPMSSVLDLAKIAEPEIFHSENNEQNILSDETSVNHKTNAESEITHLEEVDDRATTMNLKNMETELLKLSENIQDFKSQKTLKNWLMLTRSLASVRSSS